MMNRRTGWMGARSELFGLICCVAMLSCGDDFPDSSDCFELSDGSCVQETFENPPLLLPDAQGVHELVFGPTEVILNGERHCFRAYNRMYPGPTIETPARSGTDERRVRVTVENTFSRHELQNIEGEECSCARNDNSSCTPTHDACKADGCTCTNSEGDECHVVDFNATNLHAHGSHVRPDYAAGGGCSESNREDGGVNRCRRCAGDACDEGADPSCYFADDVISVVHPMEGAQHRWDIDEDGTHHDGLQWYHPHIHGTTAMQVASGAAGAWIVRGELDELPGIKNARERMMVFTMPPVGEGGAVGLEDGVECDEDNLTLDDYEILHEAGATLYYLNGKPHARLVTSPGQIERWRFLHAGFLEEVFMVLAKGNDSDCSSWDIDQPFALTQIARDGLTMPKPPTGDEWPYAPDYFFMSPGYRIDAMFDGNQLSDGDTLCLVTTRVISEERRITGTPNEDSVKQWLESDGHLLLTVNVTSSAGEATETQFPDLEEVASIAPSTTIQGETIGERCAAAKAVDEPSETDQLAILQVGFAEQVDACQCPNHNINCRNFDEADREKRPIDRALTVGAVDHWRVIASFDGHPFHIHINPFVACPLDEDDDVSRDFEPPFAHWRDTYQVNLDREIDLITEYKTYTGAFVYHCHKLTHEDAGMMELVKICSEEEDCGPYAWDYCEEDDDDCVRRLAATECHFDIENTTQCLESLALCGATPSGEGEPCMVNQDCVVGLFCGSGDVCEPLLPAGSPCASDGQCASGSCVDPAGPPPAACE